jgi:transposase
VEISRIAKWTKLKPHTLEKQYKEHLSEFNIWKNGVDAEALVYAENFGEKMSIDETSLQNGEVYTVITNKAAHGKKGALAALIKGTKNEFVTKALGKVPIGTLMRVKEISADFANSMDWICRTNFPNAIIIGDRFHAQQIVSEGVQEIRIALRRKAIDEENKLHTGTLRQRRHKETTFGQEQISLVQTRFRVDSFTKGKSSHSLR